MSLARYGVAAGFIDRPICAGFLWGLISGDMATALSLAVFYELFWLDLFPAGTYMPPNALFPMFCVFILAGTLPEPDAHTLFLPVMLTLPLAFFGSYLEKRQRGWQVAGYNKLIRRFRSGRNLDGTVQLSVWVSLFQLLLLNAVAFFSVTYLVLLASDSIIVWQGQPLTFPRASWPLLWTFGALGGIIALRIRRGYALFITGSIATGVLAMLGINL